MSSHTHKIAPPHLQRYLLAGVLTVIPLWITWLVFDFVLTQLSRIGIPWVRALSKALSKQYPTVAEWIVHPWFQPTVAVAVTLVGLYVLGWLATRVVGKRIIGAFDSLVGRVPFIQTIYGSTKKLIAALQQKPDKVRRVVLIAFPSPEMKTVGFVTRTLIDKDTGRKLAAVYVPTTPNPTSGYLEIVPLDQVVSTDWSLDEAMTFIISGGAVAPGHLNYTRGVGSADTSEDA
jgi:uncharacterized membrane protein